MKVGFVLLSGRSKPIPSTRVAVLNMLPLLQLAGVHADVLYEPENPVETPELPDRLGDEVLVGKYDLVVFQKVHGPSVLRLVKLLASHGVKTAYMVCDIVDEAMARQTDGTIVVTDFLRSLYPSDLSEKIHVVHDGIERPDVVKPAVRPVLATRRDPLRAVLVASAALDRLPVLGSPPDWLSVTIVAAYPPRDRRVDRFNWARWAFAKKQQVSERRDFLKFLAHPRIRLEQWHPNGVYEHLVDADVGIIPIDATNWSKASPGLPPSWAVKSENRLTLKMAVGLPVVASPIPSYEPVINQASSGFLARDRAEWLDALERLRDPALRQRVGLAARGSVLVQYSMQQQSQRLIHAFRAIDLGCPPDTSARPHGGWPHG